MSCQACPNLQRRKWYPALPEQIPARPLYVNSPSQFFGNLSSSVSELLITDQGAQYFHRLSTLIYIYIYLKTSGHFWKISLSTIPLKLFITEQNLYERGTAAAVVKGRLRAHYWILGHLLT